MKRNKTYKKSSSEDHCYDLLCGHFGQDDVERQVIIPGTRWLIDFYVRSIDTYVQFDGVYWHGLDRPIEVIARGITERDVQIQHKYLTDRAQNDWFKAHGKYLVRITDEEFERLGERSIAELLSSDHVGRKRSCSRGAMEKSMPSDCT